jgi:hypothetical protein
MGARVSCHAPRWCVHVLMEMPFFGAMMDRPCRNFYDFKIIKIAIVGAIVVWYVYNHLSLVFFLSVPGILKYLKEEQAKD